MSRNPGQSHIPERLQAAASRHVAQTAARSKKVHVQSPLSLSQVTSLVSSSFLRFACFLGPFLGISRCQASDVLLSISGGSWHQSLCTMVLYKPILHVLEGWSETKIGEIASSEKVGFLTGPPQSGETSPNRVKQVRVNIKISDFSPKHYPNLGKQGNPNS